MNSTEPSSESDIELSLIQRVRTNSWFRLFVYCVACLMTSCLYFGWQAYATLIIRSGAYDWKCGHGSTPVEDSGDPALCLEQSKAVSRLYAIANGSEFAFAAVAGVMLDTFGPKITATSGELLQMLSIVLLLLGQEKFAIYPFAMVLTGASVNIICFPALTVMEQWPKRQAFAVSVIVGCQSSASIVAPILKWITDKHPSMSFQKLWGLWLLIIWLPVSLIYIWTLPKARDYKALVADPQLEEGLLDAEVIDNTPEEVDEVEEKAHGWTQWKLFFQCLKTFDIWVMAIFCASLMFQFAYYPAVVKDAISMEMSDLVSWLTPLQGPFSFVIGFLMDYTGTTIVMLIMGLTLIFVSLSCAYGADITGLHKVVAVWFIFVQSATYNVKYTFVTEMYDPYNFGKLVGVLGIAGGVGVYCSNPLVESTHYATIFKALTALAGCMIIMTIVIFIRQYMGIHHKTSKPIKQTHRVVNATV